LFAPGTRAAAHQTSASIRESQVRWRDRRSEPRNAVRPPCTRCLSARPGGVRPLRRLRLKERPRHPSTIPQLSTSESIREARIPLVPRAASDCGLSRRVHSHSVQRLASTVESLYPPIHIGNALTANTQKISPVTVTVLPCQIDSVLLNLD